MRTKAIFKLLRPHQYVKNAFIFLPLFFSAEFFDFWKLFYTCIAFVGFSFLASGVYVFNDLWDVDTDRKHPEKKKRPIASGEISQGMAYGVFIALLLMGGVFLFFLPIEVAVICLVYVVLNMSYSIKLKHIAILDISVIAVGFVLRLFVGAVTGNIVLSHWIIVITFLLALFLALAKRRDDLLMFMADGKLLRKSIEGYNLTFTDTAMSMMAAVIIVAYVMYTVSPEVTNRFHTDDLYFTTFFVVLGVLRFLQITFVKEESGSPTKILLHDRALQLIVASWLILFGIIIYR